MRSLASEVIAKIGPRLGLTVNLEPQYRYVGQIITADGRKFYFRNTNFDLNGQGAAEMAKDKDYAAYFMRLLGYRVPEGETFYSNDWCRVLQSPRDIHAAYDYAKRLGFPVIVKPNSKSQGAGVAKVFTKRDFYRAMRAVFNQARDRVALVQRCIEGDDYRIVVLDGRVISAYRRIPLSVSGDGSMSIAALLAQKQASFQAAGRDTVIRLDDYRIAMRLRRLGMTLETIPLAGQRIVLLDNANLSTGGEAIDVTSSLHPEFQSLAARVSQDMGLRYCGVDVITTGPITEQPTGYSILEINAAPGLDHYAMVGVEQQRIVEAMYEQILLAVTRSE